MPKSVSYTLRQPADSEISYNGKIVGFILLDGDDGSQIVNPIDAGSFNVRNADDGRKLCVWIEEHNAAISALTVPLPDDAWKVLSDAWGMQKP